VHRLILLSSGLSMLVVDVFDIAAASTATHRSNRTHVTLRSF